MTVPLMNLGPALPSSIYIHGMPAEGGMSVPFDRNLSGIQDFGPVLLINLRGLGSSSLLIF